MLCSMSISAAERAQLQEAFSTFDTDGSGSISAVELAEILSMGGRLSDEDALREAQAVISKYDTDGSGELDVRMPLPRR